MHKRYKVALRILRSLAWRAMHQETWDADKLYMVEVLSWQIYTYLGIKSARKLTFLTRKWVQKKL